jgi:hypothetical protein
LEAAADGCAPAEQVDDAVLQLPMELSDRLLLRFETQL